MLVRPSPIDPEGSGVSFLTAAKAPSEQAKRPAPPPRQPDDRYFFCDDFLDPAKADQLLETPSEPRPTNDSAGSFNNAPAFYVHIGSVPLLTKQTEQHYFRRYNYLKYLAAQILPDASGHLSKPQQRELDTFRMVADKTRNRIVEANLRLVVALAKDYASSNPGDIDELIAVGNTALIRAVELFDFRRGLRFSTYAYQAVSRSMITSLSRGRRRSTRVKPVGDEVPDAVDLHCVDPLEDVCLKESKESARLLIGELGARDRRIVMSRFGIGQDHDGASFSKIAKEIGISTTRTVQLFHRSMEKMRRLAVNRGIIESESAA